MIYCSNGIDLPDQYVESMSYSMYSTTCGAPALLHTRKKGEGGGGISAKMFQNSEPNPDLF